MFGKIENGALILAPKMLKAGDTVCYNPDNESLRRAGYLPVEYTTRPHSGECVESWVECDGVILQTWIEKSQDANTSTPMTPEERLCQVESDLATLIRRNERLMAEVMYLCMMGGIEPMEVNS